MTALRSLPESPAVASAIQVSPGRIGLPEPPQERARREFPLLASAAPVVGSIVMWVVTGSAFALVFAVLGPAIAVASVVDDRRLARRTAKSERARFQRGVEAALAGISAGHACERESLARLAFRPNDLLRSGTRDPEWWRQTGESAVLVCLGLGTTASTLELGPVPEPSADSTTDRGGEIEAAYERLRSAAGQLTNAPVLVDSRHGIGIIGAAVPASALARSVVAQLAFQLSPADSAVRLGDGGCFDWASQLPHPRFSGGHSDRIEFLVPGISPGVSARILCAIARDAADLPRDCRIVVRLDGTGAAAVDHNPTGVPIDGLRPWFVSESECRALATMATACARADGLVRADDALADSVAFADLPSAEPAMGRLPAIFARDAAGALTLDLVGDGPHAVIGGTTGSGKSELLISWVLALAATCSPAEVNFLLVDFKGGSSFAAVSRLPHTVGLITDLDAAAASRALSSLRAELRYRERVLADAGARSIDELEGENRMPRMVIVVDEFAVVATDFPDLQVLFGDLAARGRSLGIHLVLCTQRPAGVIRDSVLANCSIRLSLRVNNGADSTAVIGTAAASELAPTAYGRCYLSIGGSEPLAAQVALATEADVDEVSVRWSATQHRLRRPWCEPLAEVVRPAHIPSPAGGPGWIFGMSDVPEEQSQPAAAYVPDRDGNLVVLGGHGSGKTGVLAALQAAVDGAVRIPSDVEGAWDAVVAAVDGRQESASAPTLYLLDDVDVLLGRFPQDYQLSFIDMLARLLREAPGRGSRMVLTAARLSSSIQSLVALCDSRLVLRLPSRQDHLLAGGDGQHYAAELPPGGGFWRGHRVQVAFVPPVVPVPAPRAEWSIRTGEGFAVVAPDARGIAERLLEDRRDQAPPPAIMDVASGSSEWGNVAITAGDSSSILVGSPASWQSQWSLLAAARAGGPVIFADCSVGEFRSLTGSRALPPPIAALGDGAWMLGTDGSVTRIALPSRAEA